MADQEDSDEQRTTIKIGFLRDNSSVISVYQPGFDAAANIAENHINSMQSEYNFEIIFADSGCSGDTAQSGAQSLINAGVVVKKFDRSIRETKISNKTVLITGSLESMSRAEAKVKIEILGAKLSSSLSKKTNFLIAGIKPTLSKVQKAKDLGVRVFSEEEWNNFINE